MKKKTVILECDNDLDDSKDLEDEYLSDLKKSSSNESSSAMKSTDKADGDQVDSNKDKDGKDADPSTVVSVDSKEKEADDSKKIVPPKDWFFPSWFSFLTFGPFVPKDKRFSLLEITETSQNVGKSRSEKRKADKLEKDAKRVSDDSAERGFTTDQKIQLQMIGLTRQSTNDRSRESRLMGLCVQEQALPKQIDRAKRIAERLAPDDMDNENNKWWKKVHTLLKQQEAIVIQMALLNNSAIDHSNGGSKDNHGSNLDNATLTNKFDVSASLTTNQT